MNFKNYFLQNEIFPILEIIPNFSSRSKDSEVYILYLVYSAMKIKMKLIGNIIEMKLPNTNHNFDVILEQVLLKSLNQDRGMRLGIWRR